jgi:hypothetical protein
MSLINIPKRYWCELFFQPITLELPYSKNAFVSTLNDSLTVLPLDSPYTPRDDVNTRFPPPFGPDHSLVAAYTSSAYSTALDGGKHIQCFYA